MKYNLNYFLAALVIHQLKKLDRFVATRREYAEIYSAALRDLDSVVTPVEKKDRHHVYHLYPILINGVDRDAFIKQMAEMGVGCSVHFIPLHLHPFYRETFGFETGDFPNAEWVYEREVSLPLYPKMRVEEVRYLIRCLSDLWN